MRLCDTFPRQARSKYKSQPEAGVPRPPSLGPSRSWETSGVTIISGISFREAHSASVRFLGLWRPNVHSRHYRQAQKHNLGSLRGASCMTRRIHHDPATVCSCWYVPSRPLHLACPQHARRRGPVPCGLEAHALSFPPFPSQLPSPSSAPYQSVGPFF